MLLAVADDPRTKKVLIVDDDDTQTSILEHVLKSEGFQVVTAADGNEAKKQIDSADPDLITMDLMLPGLSGLELVRYLQSEGKGSVPVIVVTGRASEGPMNDEQALRQEPNVVDFMQKPLRVQALVMSIHYRLNTLAWKKKNP
jgi:DNA-binding response OmpR family regulator